jgi:hypothetical protein
MPSRAIIRSAVVDILEGLSNRENISETDSLREDLQLSDAMISALAQTFTELSEDSNGASISITAADALVTVADAIELVFYRVGVTNAYLVGQIRYRKIRNQAWQPG